MTTTENITAVMALPSADSLAVEARQATATVVGITISSDSELQLVVDDLKAIKTRRDALEARRMTITRPLDQAKQAVMDLFRAPLEAMDRAISAGKQACLAYTRERDRRLAKEQAERERAAQAERDRLAAEARALADKAAATADVEQADRLRDMADAVKVQAITTVAPIMPAAPKMAGTHTAKRWGVEVTDPKALAAAMLRDHPDMFDSCWAPNEAKLRSWATLKDGKLSVDGLRVFQADTMVLR
jgi:hypothetical protein